MRSTPRSLVFASMSAAFSTILILAAVTPIANANETYEMTERSYVISTGEFVGAFCQPGDALISGSCDGVNRIEFPDEFDQPLLLESKNSKDTNREGWSCKAKHLDKTQVARITAKATCRH